MRLKELEQDLEEEEVTEKGFWKKKFKLVETFLNKTQVKDVQALQKDSKDGKLSDKEYFKKTDRSASANGKFCGRWPIHRGRSYEC